MSSGIEWTMQAYERIKADLVKAMADENADDFDETVRSVFSLGDKIGPEISALLAAALSMSWLTRPEDLALTMQRAKDPH